MLVEFEQLYGPNNTKFWTFWQQKSVFENHIWQSVDAIL